MGKTQRFKGKDRYWRAASGTSRRARLRRDAAEGKQSAFERLHDIGAHAVADASACPPAKPDPIEEPATGDDT
jgi:hypothetical protein